MEIAPGIRRIGNGLINVYLVEEAGSVTIIDAGAPGYWSTCPPSCARWAAAWMTCARSC